MFFRTNGDSSTTDNTNALHYAWLFHHVQQPSEALLQRFFSPPASKEKDGISLITDIEIAIETHPGQRNILCIEGGGTYFRVSVISPNNDYYPLKTSTQTGSTLKVPGANCNAAGWKKFIDLLDDALDTIQINHACLASFVSTQQAIIVIGMAGMGSAANREKLQEHLIKKTDSKKQRIIITSDADTYLAALSSHGAVLIAGTGSICLGLGTQGERVQAGGLGAQLSADPGSAFAMGRQATLDCLNLLNKTKVWDDHTKTFIGCDDHLYPVLIDKLAQLTQVPTSQLVAYLNREHLARLKMAELAPIVFEYAFGVKPVSLLAMKIINDIAKELAVQLGATIDTILTKEARVGHSPFHVILVGGIFESNYRDNLLGLIEHQLAIMCPDIHINWEHQPTENYVSRVVQTVTHNLAKAIEGLRYQPK